MAWWYHMATQSLVKIGSDNGLVPDGTNPLPEPMLTWNYWHPPRAILQRNMPDKLTKVIIQNYLFLRFFMYLPGDNESNPHGIIFKIHLGRITKPLEDHLQSYHYISVQIGMSWWPMNSSSGFPIRFVKLRNTKCSNNFVVVLYTLSGYWV